MFQDGKIDYGEFAAMMKKGNGGMGKRTIRSKINIRENPGVMNNGSNGWLIVHLN